MEDNKATVFVVDNDHLFSALLVDALAVEGLKATRASSLTELRERFPTESPHVLVVNVNLATGNQEELLQELRRVAPSRPVILAADFVHPEDQHRAKEAGAFDYLSRQLSLDEFARVIKKAEQSFLASQVPREDPFKHIIGQSPQMLALFEVMKRLAQSPKATVLIRGESGTGKELVARAIHYSGPNAGQPFVEINCAALPENLLESELFGYERGAFTDAKQSKRGLLELADGGTFFLDEVGDLSLRLQMKLVKAIEEKTFRRVGGTKDIKVAMRIMAATNKSLEQGLRNGTFRHDLYYRLNVVSLTLPPLRERGEDILRLARHFLDAFNREHQREVKGFSKAAEKLLMSYPWPGNVRELKNAVERAVILSDTRLLHPDHLSLGQGHIIKNFPVTVEVDETIHVNLPPQGASLIYIERALIEKALEMSKGNVCGAARLLRLSRETLRYRIRKHGIRLKS